MYFIEEQSQRTGRLITYASGFFFLLILSIRNIRQSPTSLAQVFLFKCHTIHIIKCATHLLLGIFFVYSLSLLFLVVDNDHKFIFLPLYSFSQKLVFLSFFLFCNLEFLLLLPGFCVCVSFISIRCFAYVGTADRSGSESAATDDASILRSLPTYCFRKFRSRISGK